MNHVSWQLRTALPLACGSSEETSGCDFCLPIPGVSLWKNHPGLHTARVLFPSHLLSRPQCSRKGQNRRVGGTTRGESWERGVEGRCRGAMGRVRGLGVGSDREPPAPLACYPANLRLGAPDHQKPCSAWGRACSFHGENADLDRGLPFPRL